RNSRPNGPPAASSCGCGVTLTSNVPRAVIRLSFWIACPFFATPALRAMPAIVSATAIRCRATASSVVVGSCRLAAEAGLKKRDTMMIRRKGETPRGVLKAATGHPGLRHERYHPSPDLELYVEHYWVVEWDLGQRSHRAETLPHPSVHLIFEPGRPTRIRGAARAKFS